MNNKQWQGGALVQGEPVMVPFRQTQPKPNEIEVGPGMAYSTAYAKQFADEYFWKDMILENYLFANWTFPNSNYSRDGDHVIKFGDKNRESYGTFSKSNNSIYLYKAAFYSKDRLYLTMGHEYLHKAFSEKYPTMNPFTEHAVIYTWEYLQAKEWNIQKDDFFKLIEENYEFYSPYYNPQYNYRQFNFRIKSKRPW